MRCAALALSLTIGLFLAPSAHAQTAAKRAQVGTLGITPTPPAGGVLVFSSPVVFYNSPRIAALAHEKRLPTVGPAKALGLTIPESLLRRADQIIE